MPFFRSRWFKDVSKMFITCIATFFLIITINFTKESTKPIRYAGSYPYMIFLIPSRLEDFQRRQQVRLTWLDLACWEASGELNVTGPGHMQFKAMFILGNISAAEEDPNLSNQLDTEIGEYEDVYVNTLIPEGRGIRDKVLWGLQESINTYNYSYLVKVDQDTVVDLPNLLQEPLPLEQVYTGNCLKKPKVGDFTDFKYCLGGGYVMSRDVVEGVVREGREVMGQSEDVQIGWNNDEDAWVGYLVNRMGLQPQHSPRALLNFQGFEMYNFNFWFYHWLKRPEKLSRLYECRTRAKPDCSSRKYDMSCNCTNPF